MYKQIIIVRKDLSMSCGKMAAQVSHASMAFLTNMIRKNVRVKINEECHRVYYSDGQQIFYRNPSLYKFAEEVRKKGNRVFYTIQNDDGKLVLCDHATTKNYHTDFDIDKNLYEQWINDSFTKCILEAKNKNHLLKAKTMAEELGMVEDKDLFLIKDNCYTELEPEEIDEDGVGRTLTCIGFKPMDSEIIDKIGKKYQLYKS